VRRARAFLHVMVCAVVACSTLGLLAWRCAGGALEDATAAPLLPIPALAYVPAGMVPVTQPLPATQDPALPVTGPVGLWGGAATGAHRRSTAPRAFLGGPGRAMQCPGSPAFGPHAWMQVRVTASASCAAVKAEILARISGQNGWVDPHNGGQYTLLGSTDSVINVKRLTGDQQFTDKQDFTLTDGPNGSCRLTGCSESQGPSVGDFSTNYCNLRMLYCGAAEGCSPVLGDIAIRENSVSGSIGAGRDANQCIVKKGVQFFF